MAGITGLPNFIDWARQSDPDGTIADIAWLLAQSNNMMKDAVQQVGNLPLGHKVTVNAGLPTATYRMANQGVAPSKGLTAQYQFAISELVAYSSVDKSIALLGGEVEKFRWNMDQMHIEGMGQQQASTLVYGNEAVNPSQFTGFMPFYNTLSTATAQTANNVIGMGGSASSNASILLCGWGNRTTYTIHPKGSEAGLIYENKSDIVPLYDTNNNRFEGYTSYFVWKMGLAIENWEYNVRIANIDTTTAGILGSTPPDLFLAMISSLRKLPSLSLRTSGIDSTDAPNEPQPGINPAFYCNRTIGDALDTQALRDKNVLIGVTEYDGVVVNTFRGIPIRNVDAMLNTEATIS